ncbi:putative uncharacterized protein DDB_G0282499 [Amyelois transitella]|uniref:putative uncharacterized protein DDB_G0282499 n=1 Tax=Amyelois transitella TaxID=680683 RepID=UPI00067C5898|nr:putative uncharacterized protein DDB_G0282499 [Amyelois transitella]
MRVGSDSAYCLFKMKGLLIIWAIAACAYAVDSDDVQSVKSVKGGLSRYIYKGDNNISRFYNSRQFNLTKHKDVEEIGVCYIEIPTAQLVQDQNHVPAGNGSRPELSRIRSCCHGYARNIHDFMVCEPVCSKGCINSLCVAPETCQCYPDYVKNSAGFCTATCPIGCQNGRCSGGECICNSGYKLDSESKYCVPSCKDGCGGSGNCTAPNTCTCQPGYQSTPEGSCKASCEHCENGECVAPNRCNCRTGYSKDPQGKCKPQCTPACRSNTNCIAPNVCSAPSEFSPQNHGLPLNVMPLHPENQVNNTTRPLQPNTNHYPNPYNPNYPQGPYYQYPGNNPNYNTRNLSNGSHDSSYSQQGQISQRPDEGFYFNQGNYPYPGGQNPQQGIASPNNTLYPSLPRSGQESNHYPGNNYPGNNPNYNTQNLSNGSHDSSYSQQGQISQRPDEGFYFNQGNYPYPGGQNPQQGIASPNNTLYPSPPRPEQESNHYPGNNYPGRPYQGNQYPGGQYPENQYSGNQYPNGPHVHQNEPNSSQPHRGDIDSDSNQGSRSTSPNNTIHGYPYPGSNRNPIYQESNSYYAGGRQQNTSFNSMNQYGSSSYDSSDQRHGQTYQGSYNRSQQESHDSRNQRNFDSTQHQSYDISNQRSYDSSHRESHDSSQHGQYGSEYQSNYGNFNRDSQNSSVFGQLDAHHHNYSNQDTQHSNQGLQHSSNQDTQNSYHHGNSSSNQGSTQYGSYDSSRRESLDSTNQRNHQGFDRANQATYPYFNSGSNPREAPEVSNQVANQSVDNTGHTYVHGFADRFDIDNKENIDQQSADVPVCSKACINSYCVEGNECRCKPGYIPDRTNLSVCQPHCPGGCPNGVCSGPRLCLCNAGYYKDTSVKGRQVCVKRNR